MTTTPGPADAPPVRRAAGMLLPPPTYPVLLTLAAWWIGRSAPLALPRGPIAILVGGSTGLLALLILITAWRTFRAARTSIEPWQPSKHLITGGIFARSRNPVYVGFLLAQLSVAWLTANAWTLLFVPITWLLLDRLQVRREERYLTATFGEPYAEYCRRAPRWL
jgi:protein-S-isoprenylcysteine O-methyltransferase Ste14